LKRSEAAGLASLSITRKTRVVRCIQPTLISRPVTGTTGPSPIRCGTIPTRAPSYRSYGGCRGFTLTRGSSSRGYSVTYSISIKLSCKFSGYFISISI
jgi:hypothetical protein